MLQHRKNVLMDNEMGTGMVKKIMSKIVVATLLLVCYIFISGTSYQDIVFPHG